MESDERLFERMRAGELDAFDRLYERYEHRLFAFVHMHLNDRAEAEDIFHEAFIGVLRSRDLDFSRGTFRAWLFQIARNACLNRLRSRSRGNNARELLQWEPPATEAAGPDQLMDSQQKAAELERAVAHLPAALAEMYRLRVQGMSYEEMAQVLVIPIGTVKSRMHEMVTQLKREMKTWTAS